MDSEKVGLHKASDFALFDANLWKAYVDLKQITGLKVIYMSKVKNHLREWLETAMKPVPVAKCKMGIFWDKRLPGLRNLEMVEFL